MDVAIIDMPWNGMWQSMKIAAPAEAHEVNVAPHNFYGHLCTMMAAHFAPRCRTCASWRPTSIASPGTTSWSTHPPVFEDGHLVVPDRPGWGAEPNEEAIRAHPPKGKKGLLDYGRKG